MQRTKNKAKKDAQNEETKHETEIPQDTESQKPNEVTQEGTEVAVNNKIVEAKLETPEGPKKKMGRPKGTKNKIKKDEKVQNEESKEGVEVKHNEDTDDESLDEESDRYLSPDIDYASIPNYD